jgi:hypothetical protein
MHVLHDSLRDVGPSVAAKEWGCPALDSGGRVLGLSAMTSMGAAFTSGEGIYASKTFSKIPVWRASQWAASDTVITEDD